MKPKVLTMCSSRNRPGELIRMLESFSATKTLDTEIAVYISLDDPHLQEYIDALRGREWLYFIGPHKYMAEVLNFFSREVFPDCDYYQEVNDDHIYQTVGWDEMLVRTLEEQGQGWGIACPNSMIDKSPSAYMISGNMVRLLDWFILPGLRHNSGDCSTFMIGNGLQRLFHVEEAHIYHKSWHATQFGYDTGAPKDDNCDFVYSEEEEALGKKVCDEWDCVADVKRINDAIIAEGKDVFNIDE